MNKFKVRIILGFSVKEDQPEYTRIVETEMSLDDYSREMIEANFLEVPTNSNDGVILINVKKISEIVVTEVKEDDN